MSKFLLTSWCENFLQMAVAVKKILYAADAKQSALEEAQLYMQQSMNLEEVESDDKAWDSLDSGKKACNGEPRGIVSLPLCGRPSMWLKS